MHSNDFNLVFNYTINFYNVFRNFIIISLIYHKKLLHIFCIFFEFSNYFLSKFFTFNLAILNFIL